uniref:Uncharacterized protein n=1 Tax=Parascaris univalens TaxID=6257 RepID=A0A915BTG3_PARUN
MKRWFIVISMLLVSLFIFKCEGCRKKRYKHSCRGFHEVIAICTDDPINGRMAGNELHYRCANDHFCSACQSIAKIKNAEVTHERISRVSRVT